MNRPPPRARAIARTRRPDPREEMLRRLTAILTAGMLLTALTTLVG